MASPKYQDPLYVRTRAAWAPRVAEGSVVCHLCGKTIVGAFDLDHVRNNRGTTTPTVALHPAHPTCNRIEGGRWKGRKRLAWGSGRR